MQKEVTILAPAFNEENNLTLFAQNIAAKIPNNWEVLIVNDGSTDSSEYELQKLSKDYKNFYIRITPQKPRFRKSIRNRF